MSNNGHTKTIEHILEKVHAGERISYEEGLLLYEQAELLDLAEAANARRQQINPGDVVSYLIDRNINYTNVCVTDCQFCNFYTPRSTDAKAYVNSKEVLGRKIEEARQLGATRILMQGGHNPDLPFEYYTDLVGWIHRTFPQIEIDAFSPSEIEFMANISGKSWEEVLTELKAVGLAGLPGGGGEILDDEIRNLVSPKKIKTANWLGVMKVAHRLDLTTTATMVIGFTETPRHRMNHFQRLRDTQDDSLAIGSRGFNAFISWTVQIENTPLGRSKRRDLFGATPQEYLRHTVMARIFLDNIPHLSASWPTQGAKVGQVALHFGCDDFGSTMIEENVVSAAGAPTKVSPMMTVHEIHRQIREAGFVPAQRNTRYEIMREYRDGDEDLPPEKVVEAENVIPLAVLN
ncbi:MAG: dehypoxanthine futalosine cyclase [Chloroflexi bacterium]|nr:dehypoxanthine futalosine cyclase [Chloroflexota bacterium]